MTESLTPEDFSCPLPIRKHDRVQLSHGSGGKFSGDLISQLFVWAFDNPELRRQDDSALLETGGGKLAFSTDSFVVDPIFFPGGDIGDLAVNGTINDICTSGAQPLYMSAGFIIEEGLPLVDLKNIVLSMKRALEASGVTLVTGDTKVVNKGKGDKLFINTTGIGIIEHDFTLGPDQLKPGDKILVSGSIADHGMAILSVREGLAFDTPIMSDTAALNGLVADLLKAGGNGIHAMRDPTRGGLSATLNEFASASGVHVNLAERALPIRPQVKAACELLGLDSLYVANEGKLVVVVDEEASDKVLSAMREHPLGKDAVVIGEVLEDCSGLVSMRTRIGGERIVDMPLGEQLPRIC
jgi:hydrogenase expression/formation protein HypE